MFWSTTQPLAQQRPLASPPPPPGLGTVALSCSSSRDSPSTHLNAQMSPLNKCPLLNTACPSRPLSEMLSWTCSQRSADVPPLEGEPWEKCCPRALRKEELKALPPHAGAAPAARGVLATSWEAARKLQISPGCSQRDGKARGMYLVMHAARRPEKCSQCAQRGGGKTSSVGSLCAARQCRGTWEMGAAPRDLGGQG